MTDQRDISSVCGIKERVSWQEWRRIPRFSTERASAISLSLSLSRLLSPISRTFAARNFSSRASSFLLTCPSLPFLHLVSSIEVGEFTIRDDDAGSKTRETRESNGTSIECLHGNQSLMKQTFILLSTLLLRDFSPSRGQRRPAYVQTRIRGKFQTFLLQNAIIFVSF